MTRFERAFVWVGGALFVGSLAFWLWWYLVALPHSAPWTGWRPLVADAALFTLFAAHHSILARDGIKRRLSFIPTRLHRSVYVWMASALLLAVCLLWQSIGGELWAVGGAGMM